MTEMNQTDSYPEGTSGLESKEQDINSQTTRQPRLENTGQEGKALTWDIGEAAWRGWLVTGDLDM